MAHSHAGDELAVLAHAIWRTRGTRGRGRYACIGAGVVWVPQQRRALGDIQVREIVIGGSVRAEGTKGGGGRSGCCAADGVMALLLLKIGIVDVVAVVDTVVGSRGLGHGVQA